MNPEYKSPEIDAFLTKLTGRNRREAVHEGFCMLCGGPAIEFRDELSRRENSISGTCQKCQDSVFGESDE